MPTAKKAKQRESMAGWWRPWWRDWPAFQLDRNGVADPALNLDEAHVQFWKPMERAAWIYEIVRRLSKAGTLNNPNPIPDADLEQIATLPPFSDLSAVQRSELRHILTVHGQTRPLFVVGWHPQFVEAKYSSLFPGGYFDLEAGDNAVLLLVQEWLHEQRRIRGIEPVGKGNKQSKNQNQEYKPVHWNHLEQVEEKLEPIKPSDNIEQRKNKNLRAKNKSKCKGKLGAIGEHSWRLVLLAMSLASFQLGITGGASINRIPSGWEGQINFSNAELIWIFSGRHPDPTPGSNVPTKVTEASTVGVEWEESLIDSAIDDARNSLNEGMSGVKAHAKNLESLAGPLEREAYIKGAMDAAWVGRFLKLPTSPRELQLPKISENEAPYWQTVSILEEMCQAGQLTKEQANKALERLRNLFCDKALSLHGDEVKPSPLSAAGQAVVRTAVLP